MDLSRHAGRGRELILESRGFEGKGDPERAYWGAPALSVPRRAAPVVIVYLVDTLRADHTTPYGYARETTPELAAFAKDAVVFETAVAQASWTKPSVASILTSQLPGIHRAVQLRDPLDSGQVTLAEMLQAKGYATGAAIANWVIYSEGNNFEQGFDVFTGLHGADDRPSKLVEAAAVVDAGLAWLDARQGVPTFLYAHTMDPHVPYAAPAPFNHKFAPPPAEGRAGVGSQDRLQGSRRSRHGSSPNTTATSLTATRSSGASSRSSRSAASTTARFSCSWPTTARNSRITAHGSTGAASSTSSSASP